MPKRSLVMIVPALDEEGDLEATITNITMAISEDKNLSDYEIIIIDDGSHDQTGSIADHLARSNQFIKVIHHHQPMGLGYCYREGVKLGKLEYIGWAPGKNSIPLETFHRMFKAIDKADIVLVYILSETRNHFRRIVSKLFTLLMNLLFGLHVKYFNGPCIYRADLLRKTKMTTNGFAFMAEINIRLLKAGHSYVEVGLHNRDRTQGSSKALVFRNFLRVVDLVIKLFWDLQVKERFYPAQTKV